MRPPKTRVDCHREVVSRRCSKLCGSYPDAIVTGDQACPATAVACFHRHVTKSRSLDRPDRTEIKLFNQHDELFVLLYGYFFLFISNR